MMFAPKIFGRITFESKVMQEEIFDRSADRDYDISIGLEVLKLCRNRWRYIFYGESGNRRKVLNVCVRAAVVERHGAACIAANDAVGGVGKADGMYHGRYTFDTFTHKRAF
jgi:hypothetical protein